MRSGRVDEESPDFQAGHETSNIRFRHLNSAKVNLINMLCHVLNTGYYMGVSPVKYKFHGNVLYKQIGKLQQKICGLLTVLYLTLVFARMRKAIPDRSVLIAHPSTYFDLMLAFCAPLYLLTTARHLWFNNNDYLEIMHIISTENILPLPDYWVTKPKALVVRLLLLIAKISLSFISGYGFIDQNSDWTASLWIRSLVSHGRFVYGFTTSTNTSVLPELEDITFGDGIRAVFTGLAIFFDHCMLEFADELVLVSALILWLVAKALAVHVQRVRRDRLARNVILCQVVAVKRLSDAFNCAISAQVGCYLAAGLPHYSISMSEIFISEDIVTRIRGIHTCVSNIVFFYLAVDARLKMAVVDEWLDNFEDSHYMSYDEARPILRKSIIDRIGIQAGWMLTISPSFLAKYCLAMTIFFIKVSVDGDRTQLSTL